MCFVQIKLVYMLPSNQTKTIYLSNEFIYYILFICLDLTLKDFYEIYYELKKALNLMKIISS